MLGRMVKGMFECVCTRVHVCAIERKKERKERKKERKKESMRARAKEREGEREVD